MFPLPSSRAAPSSSLSWHSFIGKLLYSEVRCVSCLVKIFFEAYFVVMIPLASPRIVPEVCAEAFRKSETSAPCDWTFASERRKSELKGVRDFYLKAKARIWYSLSCIDHVRSARIWPRLSYVRRVFVMSACHFTNIYPRFPR